MASSSGNSTVSGSSVQNSGSEEKLQVLRDERKRKRMQSNRESARRSRMRKQKHLDDLTAQVTQLRKDNSQILNTINLTTQHYLNVEAHNSILRAQMMELKQRLDSLDDIINVINIATNNNNNDGDNDNNDNNNNDEGFGFDPSLDGCFMSNTMNKVYLNQPIMASPDLFQY